jgi:hypothetical protein
MNITMKQVDSCHKCSKFEEISPMEMTIEKRLRAADERRKIERIQL